MLTGSTEFVPAGDSRVWEARLDPPPGRRWVGAIRVVPSALTLAIGAALLIPATRELVLPLVDHDPAVREKHAVELATFGLSALAALGGLALAAHFGRGAVERAFFLLFALVMAFIAGEEVAWGQWFLSYETPDWMREINMQGEMTLHNLEPLQGRSEAFRLAFGFAGLVGLHPPLRWLRSVRVPACLAPTLLTIVALATVDAVGDSGLLPQRLEEALSRLAEAVELLVAFVGATYAGLHLRARRAQG